jgi:hypothetical protein
MRVGYSRAEDPSNYWFHMTDYGAVFLCMGALLAFFGVAILLDALGL